MLTRVLDGVAYGMLLLVLACGPSVTLGVGRGAPAETSLEPRPH